MAKVNANFNTMFGAFIGFAVLALILSYAMRVDCAQGMGAVLMHAGGLGIRIDGYASRHAEPYTLAIEPLAHAHGANREYTSC